MQKTESKDYFMMFSNLFLLLPVVWAGVYSQWLYLFLASGLAIFSPLYHWYRINNKSYFYTRLFNNLDWLFAIGAFAYMFFYVYKYVPVSQKIDFYVLLSLLILFFWYGYKFGSYAKIHPWFHIFAPIVSSAILIVANGS